VGRPPAGVIAGLPVRHLYECQDSYDGGYRRQDEQ
jgi:hypothetical protein